MEISYRRFVRSVLTPEESAELQEADALAAELRDHLPTSAAYNVFITRRGRGQGVTTPRVVAAFGKQALRGVLGEGRGGPMLAEDGLVVADAYLDQARRHLERVDPTRSTPSAAGDEALDRFSASERVRGTSVGLERARTYLRAARQTIGDVADEVARGSVGRVGEDLRLLERLCAMVDELSGRAARTLAAMSQDPAAPDAPGRRLSADLSSIREARLSAQAAGRLAAELAAHQRRGPLVTAERVAQRLRAEQQGRRPASNSAVAIGVPR
ncbi:hypothetical protein BH11ACT1_BH11ACT1_14280 [soil metagenome]